MLKTCQNKIDIPAKPWWNKRWKHFGPGNKPYAAAFVESLVLDKVDTLVLLDSDTIFCCPPDQLVLQENEVVALRPVDLAGVGLLTDG